MSADEVSFVLNEVDVRLRGPDPELLLVDYLRSVGVGLTGTKLVCGEGGCGACTVTIAHVDPHSGAVVERPANACLRPVCTLDGTRVTTVEGLGRVRTGLNPIQQRIADHNGSQCGYCTPGWVMTMYGLLRDDQAPSAQQVEDQFAGNLCRCTGMRPILDAMQSFVGDPTACRQAAGAPYAPEQFPPARPISISGRRREYHRVLSVDDALALLAANAGGGPVMLMNGNTSVGIYKRDVYDPRVLIDVSRVPELGVLDVESGGVVTVGGGVTLTSLRDFVRATIADLDPSQAAGLVALDAHLRRVAGEQVRGVGTVAGNLMLALSHQRAGEAFPSDLLTVLGGLGATLTIRAPGQPDELTFPLLEFPDPAKFPQGFVITRVAIPPTNAATIVQTYKVARRVQNAHALVNAAMSCDLDPQATVTRACLVVGGIARIACRLPRTEAALVGKPWTFGTLRAARDVLVQEVAALLAPFPSDGVSDAYRAGLVESLFYKYWTHVATAVAPGEVDPRNRSAGTTYERPISGGEHCFVQAPYHEDESLQARLSGESLHPGTPSYAAERRAAAADAAGAAGVAAASGAEHVIAVNRAEANGGASDHPRVKASAYAQASGEIKYTQDAPLPPGMLQAAYVYSTANDARFDYGSLDAVKVEQRLRDAHPGFIAYVTAADVPNHAPSDTYSDAEPAAYDPIFASGRVTAYGQPIGLVLADTADIAREAAASAQALISYHTSGLTPVLTLEESRALPGGGGLMNKAAIGRIERPGSDPTWLANPGPVAGKTYVTGTQVTGGQAHFYFETQASVAIPEEDGMIVYASSQHLAGVQGAVATALGLPLTKVEARTRALGGGYGGKEVRPPYFAAAAAVAAWKVNRPVRLALDRNTDMLMVGKRHPFEGTFDVLADPSGRIEKMRVNFASDGGYSYDCSSPVMDLVLLSADNAYNVKDFQVNGNVYRTNRATNTAFRSFGVIQCTLIVEEAIERVAYATGLSPEDVRRANFYRDATADAYDVTPYGQALKYARINQVWDDVLEMAGVEDRRKEIAAFNAANRWRKRGLAVIPIKYGISYTYLPMNQATGEIIVYTDGSVLVHHGGIEMGQGIDTKITQIVADALGIDFALVEAAPPDTASIANASSTGASTGTDLQGGAALAAAKQMRARLEDFCRQNPKLVPDHWETAWSQDWPKIVTAAYDARVDLTSQASYASPDLGDLDKNGQLAPGKQIFYYFTYSAGASEVEVDVLTGETTILRSDLIYDAGQTPNSTLDFGQVEGGFVQGIGCVTTEQLYYDEGGRLIPDGTWNYKPPCSKTIPVDLRVGLLEYVRTDHATDTPIDRYGIMSSKAVGEPPLVLAASVFFAIKRAVAEARADAGLPVPFDLPAPATVERIRNACIASQQESPHAQP